MDIMCGKFQQERCENLDEYFRAVGVPYFVRLMLCSSKPSMEISKVGDRWTIKTSSLLRTTEFSFVEGEEYIDKMPNGVELKNVTEIKGDEIVTVLKGSNGEDGTKTYRFSEKELVMTLRHESGVEAKRYFKRIEE